MDYKDTLNLPRTDFKMKASLPQKEPEILNLWNESDIYSRIKLSRANQPKYVLHDGPPYANGHIHIGHALNKTLKDVVLRYKTMKGFYCEYVPGWDCHGLPVEHELFKKMNKKKTDIPQIEFRKKAHDYAMKFVDIQGQEFQRLGIFGQWQDPYLTTDKKYEASIIRSFGTLVEKGYIYQGRKPVNWCYRCETALAEAEVEYNNYTSPSVYVKFKLKDTSQLAAFSSQLQPAACPSASTSGPLTEVPRTSVRGNLKPDTYILIWTTTPWTLIANVAVAVHPENEYVIVETKDGNIILAHDLLKQVCEKTGMEQGKIISVFKGKDIENLYYEHPFGLREGRVVLADYVSMEEGTGCVHTAPGHGQDDHVTGQAYGLETIMPVDEKGSFTDAAGEFKGENVHKANTAIIDKIRGLGLLYHDEPINHSYPHCWRCKSPIIFRATEQWFMSIGHNNLRNAILERINQIHWVPAQGKDRISSMLSTRPDWCLSRQRYWGVPIPVFECIKCKKWIADNTVIEHFADIVEQKGTDAWFELDAKSLLPAGYKCSCGSSDFKKGQDILDVWFESGVSHQGVLKQREGLAYPCDLYLEGSDQHRGWFQSSLITSMAIDDIPAFKSVLTHGFVVDGMGRKMSKSLGNVISPQEIIKDYGADILRLWVAFSDYNDDIRISDQIIARLVEAYRKIRNTARFMLGNIYDFDLRKDKIEYDKMREIDKWAISRAHRLLRDVTDFYESFQFHKVYHNLYTFCIVDMSNFYMDIVKDVLYTFKNNSYERRSCQSALYIVLGIIAKVIAPVLVFTSEEIWRAMHLSKEQGTWQSKAWAKEMPESVHLSSFDSEQTLKINDGLENKFLRLKKIREAVLKVLEARRVSGIIGSSLEARVRLYTERDSEYSFLKENEAGFSALFIVSQAQVEKGVSPDDAVVDEDVPLIRIAVDRATGEKCSRCWNFSDTTGKHQAYPGVCKRCHDVLISMKGEVS
jgi:isoleucyl-tRNA synthetase